MARTRIGFGKKKRKVFRREWENMDNNLLLKIFSRLPADNLFFTVSMVCRSWRSCFWEAFFWKDHHTLDLSHLKSLVRCVYRDLRPWDQKEYQEAQLNAMKSMLMNPNVLGNGERCVTSIIVPRNMYISGHKDLIFISKRTQSLRRLALQDAYGLEDGCFSEALKNWKSLEEMYFGPAYNRHVVHVVRELGTHCKNLLTLHLDIIRFMGNTHFKLDLSGANLVANYLPKLKEFSVANGDVYGDAVSVILNEYKQLSDLCIESCHILPDKIYQVSVKFKKKNMGINSTSKWHVISCMAGRRTTDVTGNPVVRCLDEQETLHVVREIHKGCDNIYDILAE